MGVDSGRASGLALATVVLVSSGAVLVQSTSRSLQSDTGWAAQEEDGQRHTTGMGDYGSWFQARATNYGFGGNMDINYGSCEYYNLMRDKATGWDIAAMSDKNDNYYGSCGRCYEVKCSPSWLKDGFGVSIDRTPGDICRDPSASVVVQITDTCRCDYPANPISNKRWCCGDMQHFDLSVWTFQKFADLEWGVLHLQTQQLADLKWGVLSLQARQVPCGYQVSKRAQLPSNPVYPDNCFAAPGGWGDRRPWPANTPSTGD